MKDELKSAKEKLTENAEGLSVRLPVNDHPYMSLGAAFLSGAALGAAGDTEVGTGIVRTFAEVVCDKVLSKEKK